MDSYKQNRDCPMRVREMIETYYPNYSWFGSYPAKECAAFNKITEQWGIFSNFGKAHIIINGLEFHNTEQLFHLMKFRDPNALLDVYTAKGLTLKHKAKKWEKICLRDDWPQIIIDALKFCLIQKYNQCEEFRNELEHSKGLYIVEDESTRRSTSYGMQLRDDYYVGANLMGRLLMELRDNKTLSYTLPEDALDFVQTIKKYLT